MATKHDCKCLQKAADNEPIFVLRAQDCSAPETILFWLTMNPNLPQAKRLEAIDCYEAMKEWPTTKNPD